MLKLKKINRKNVGEILKLEVFDNQKSFVAPNNISIIEAYLAIIENYGFNNIKVKHGKMEADVIHLSVYKKEIRRNSNKSWLPSNENFICNVQYDINKKFKISNKLVDKQLKLERVGNLEYKWNPNFK